MRAFFYVRASVLLLFLPGWAAPLFGQRGAEPVTLQVKNEEAVNSKGLDFSPTFYQDGIVFISTNNVGLKKITDSRLKLPAMSILQSRRGTEGALAKPEPFSKQLTSKFHEGPVCFDRTAERIFFSSNVQKKGQPKKAKDGKQKMKLYVAHKTGETWGEPEALPFNTDQYDDCHPSVSIDGDKLFFASNRPGGFGGMDLYVSFRLGDAWSDPLNLGPKVNTSGNEAFPFLHADNTLYFASDGRPGQGGFDLFYTLPDGSDWIAPVNLGSPFNTKGDDFGVIVDLDKINGYYSTNGNGGLGGDDIFSFHIENGNLDDYLLQNKRVPDREAEVTLTVFDTDGKTPLADAIIQILNLEQNNVVGRDSLGNVITLQNVGGQDVMKVQPQNRGATGTTDAEGRFPAALKPGNYVIIIGKEGYQTKQIRQKIGQTGSELVVALEKSAGKAHWNATLFNDLTNTPLAGTTMILTNQATGKKDTVTTDANGVVDYYLDQKSKYAVDIYQNGKLKGSTKLDTEDWTEENSGKMTLNLAATPFPAGTVIELPNIYFNYNDASLRPDARKDLDLVADLLRQYPQMVIELSSHTDSRGTTEYNRGLSQRRADRVAEYLIRQKKVDPKRLRPKGYGESQPRNQCTDDADCSEREHARNRRTEIRVLAGADGLEVVATEGDPQTEGATLVNQAPSNVQVSRNDRLDYYVIAGSFLMENRAKAQLERLKSAGYEEAEVRQFGKSPFFSVVAGRANTLEAAQALKRQIESKNEIEAFVKPVRR
ncbi:MAG: OmpA family protein [Saprospiraceae bacterium]